VNQGFLVRGRKIASTPNNGKNEHRKYTYSIPCTSARCPSNAVADTAKTKHQTGEHPSDNGRSVAGLESEYLWMIGIPAINSISEEQTLCKLVIESEKRKNSEDPRNNLYLKNPALPKKI
jgi:hypothetical protein